ncbi:sulfur carrier protein ThiS [Polaribacter sp. Asnod1-A03]|uniref:sulfur carrier protein ThiS n=1 Tax=Polaribacter sp. Asnod1-A03 TaxID=3160581 RepID=UPI00386BCD21
MMTIKVNNETQEISNKTTLQELVEHLKIQTNGIAIAINNNVVKKTEWSLKNLQQEDVVLIIKSTQGG